MSITSISAAQAPVERSPVRDELPALTGIRFFAAAIVVFGHFCQNGLISMPQRLFEMTDGRSAVSLFFVLSGFILTYNYDGRLAQGKVRKFYIARFARIYPVLVLSILVGAAGAAWILFSGRKDLLLGWFALKDHYAAALCASLVAQLAVVTGWFPIAAINQPFDGPAWSLSCEVFFYALFPFLLRGLRRCSAHRLLGWAFAAFIAQAVWIVLVQSFLPLGRRGFILSQFPLTHLAEFVYGIIAGIFYLNGTARNSLQGSRSTLVFWMTAALLLAEAYFEPAKPRYLVESPLFAALILSLALRPTSYTLFSSRPSVLLGGASFSLYLVHVPLLRLFLLMGVSSSLGFPLIGVMIITSVLIFKFYEEPMRKRIVRTETRRQPLET